MSKHKREIRAILNKFPDGLTALDISRFMELRDSTNVTGTLRKMEDAYIDRWEKKRTGQYAAVWCLATIPEDCPRPDISESHKRRLERTQCQTTKSTTQRASQ